METKPGNALPVGTMEHRVPGVSEELDPVLVRNLDRAVEEAVLEHAFDLSMKWKGCVIDMGLKEKFRDNK